MCFRCACAVVVSILSRGLDYWVKKRGHPERKLHNLEAGVVIGAPVRSYKK